MTSKINKEESISRVYQFLNSYKGDWKADADRNGDNVIIKSEFGTFLKKANFDFNFNGVTVSENDKQDIIKAFWDTIDIEKTGKLNSGKNISDKGALNTNELNMASNNIKATNIVNKFMNNKTMPKSIDSNWEKRWRNSVESGMINQAIAFLKDNKKELSEEEINKILSSEVLDGFYKSSAIKATADYKAREWLDTLKNQYRNIGYTVDDDKVIESIINEYINQLGDSDKSLEEICKDVESIMQAYIDTAKTNSQESINKLTQYGYDPIGLNPLQIAILTADFKHNLLEKAKEKNAEVCENYDAALNSVATAYIENIISSVNDYNKIRSEMNSYIDSFIKTQFSNLENDYKEKQKELNTAREELKTYIYNILAEEDENKNAIIKEIFGSTDKTAIETELSKIKKIGELKSLKSKIETKLNELSVRLEAEKKAREEKYKQSFSDLSELIDDIITDKLSSMIGNFSTIHTEFGVDSNGNIVFQEKNTQEVYNKVQLEVLNQFKIKNREAYDAIGESKLKKIIQSAWIMTYNDYKSSESHSTAAFVQTVLTNLEKILSSISKNPEYADVYAADSTAYSNSKLTHNLPHYNRDTTAGGDEVIIYEGDFKEDADGTVHIADATDDIDYQTTMTVLLSRIKKTDPYTKIDPAVITSVFQDAQKQALSTCINNEFDCPYGTGNNDSRVEDTTRDWSGSDNRGGDRFRIDMDQLVQLTLYFFDKLLYAKLAE